MLEIQKFLNEHPTNWEALLSTDPYNLTIRKKEGLVLFMYNQISSNFDIPLVQECRGIILEENSWVVKAMGFTKFWNIQEGRAAKIDWPTARILTKLDGSIQKLFYYKDEWRVSTMSMIDARECTLMNDLNPKYQTFNDLFMEGAKNCSLDFDKLNKSYSYTFEICSEWNRVVIPYKGIKLYHLTTRDNNTLQELDVDIGVEKPKEYKFSSMEDVMAMAQTLPFSEEGYVVVDGNWNRVKIKSPAYLSVHKLHNNGNLNKTSALEMIMRNDHHEYLSYFDTYKDLFAEIERTWNAYIAKIEADVLDITSKEFPSRKEYAMYAKTLTNPVIMFLLLDKKVTKDNWKVWLNSQTADKMAEILKI